MPTIKAADLRPGDVIQTSKGGMTVAKLSRGESCNGMHVNNTQCYDRAMPVTIASRG